MATDYSFFERTLFERRTYRAGWDDKQLEYLEHEQIKPHIRFLNRQPDDFVIRGTHVMNPPSPLGLAQVNERFNITLPQDIDNFYRKWDGGLLLFRKFYPLLSAKQIIEVAEEMRTLHKEPLPPQLPWHLIRFCDVGDGNYFALRLEHQSNQWEIIFASVETWDTDHIQGKEPHAKTDADFHSWLKRMCETDGWPLWTDDNEPEDPPAERID